MGNGVIVCGSRTVSFDEGPVRLDVPHFLFSPLYMICVLSCLYDHGIGVYHIVLRADVSHPFPATHGLPSHCNSEVLYGFVVRVSCFW